MTGLGKRKAQLAALTLQKGVRQLDQDSRPVTGILLAAAGSAVHEIPQDGQRVRDDLVRPATLDVHYEADAASIVLVTWVVQPLMCMVILFQIHSPISFVAGGPLRHLYCRTDQLCVF